MVDRVRRQALLISMGFVVIALALGYWQVIRADDVLARPSNPRLAEEDRRIQRGQILDRNGGVLASSTRNGDVTTRTYTYSPLSPVIGYYSTRYGGAGIEESFDGYLRGERETDPLTALQNHLLRTARRGSDLTLTLDLRLQRVADRALGDHPGAIVALNAATGEVLAMASHPYFNPNTLDQDWNQLREDSSGVLIDRVTNGEYVPGSIFKIVTAGAALDLGVANQHMPIHEEAADLVVDGFVIHNGNHPGMTNLTFGSEFAWSSNGCFGFTGLSLSSSGLIDYRPLAPAGSVTWTAPPGVTVAASAERLRAYATKYGIGQSVPFDLPTAAGRIASHNTLTAAELASTAFGQGELAVTPLQMVLAAATVANGGDMPAPYLARAVRNVRGEVSLHPPSSILRQVLGHDAAAQLNDMMVLSVDTAYASPAKIAGVRVGGKTGTAEVGGGQTPHSWFIGYAPAGGSAVAVAVIMEHRGSGTEFATPAGREVLNAALQMGY